jgi:outer membrane protein TolC
LAKEGYKEGEFKYLELLDAQKTFILIKRQYVEVLGKYNLLNLEIEYLLGGEK